VPTKSRSVGAPAKGPEPLRRSKEAVKMASLVAAYELMTASGLSGVSVDEVSRRSGVAKTTIYRHWPSRSALLLEACMQFAPRLQGPNTGTFKGDLTAIAMAMAQRLQTGGWSSVVPSIIDAAERDQELAELQSRQHARDDGCLRADRCAGTSARRAGPEFRCIRTYCGNRRAALLSPLVFAAKA